MQLDSREGAEMTSYTELDLARRLSQSEPMPLQAGCIHSILTAGQIESNGRGLRAGISCDDGDADHSA